MRAGPDPASPGVIVELYLPEATHRGLAFALEQQRGDTWELGYFLVAASKGGGAAGWWTRDDAEDRG